MKIAITIATKEGKMSVLYGPDVPFGEQKAEFKKLVNDNGGGYDELQIITSVNGRERRKKFKQPTEEPEEPEEISPNTPKKTRKAS